MKTELMKKAWEIAREGQAQFGGSVKSFFSESLKIAWVELTQGKIMEHTINALFKSYNERRYSRPWGAIITEQGGKVSYDFSGSFLGEHGHEGNLILKAKTGDIIAIGQKDGRKPKKSLNQWYKVIGSTSNITTCESDIRNSELSKGLEEISKNQAMKYLLSL